MIYSGCKTLGDEVIMNELEKLDDLESYQGKWKNLHFLKNGRTTTTDNVHNSEEAAKRADDVDKAVAAGKEVDTLWTNLKPPTLESHISHTIQIPVST